MWIVRINPQQWPYVPDTNADIQDRENELMGNLSLHKELDFIVKVNEWSKDYPDFGRDHKQVTVRTIKMKKKTADDLQYASKFDRSREFSEKLRDEGCEVGRKWLDDWRKGEAGKYPEDAGYRSRSQSSERQRVGLAEFADRLEFVRLISRRPRSVWLEQPFDDRANSP